MVFQEPQTPLNPVRSIGWQLAEAVRAHRRLSRRAARTRALELLQLVGIPEPERRLAAYSHQLSGGQKQRVVIALSLMNDPVLLVADEPTTALDVTIQAEILDLLRALPERLGTAVLLITHNMGVVADLADRVLVMRRGRMVERGEIVSLFAGPYTDYTRELLASVPQLPISGWSRAGADTRRTRGDRPLALRGGRRDTRLPRSARPARFPRRDRRQRGPRSRTRARGGRRVGLGQDHLGQGPPGELQPSSGRVMLHGIDLAGLSAADLRRRRRHLGVVHQDPATTLDPLIPIGDSIATTTGAPRRPRRRPAHSDPESAGRGVAAGRLRAAAPARAVRRPAATRGPGPRAGPAPGAADRRRTDQRARRDRAGRHAEAARRPTGRAGFRLRLHQPRPGCGQRGDRSSPGAAGRPGRGVRRDPHHPGPTGHGLEAIDAHRGSDDPALVYLDRGYHRINARSAR